MKNRKIQIKLPNMESNICPNNHIVKQEVTKEKKILHLNDYKYCKASWENEKANHLGGKCAKCTSVKRLLPQPQILKTRTGIGQLPGIVAETRATQLKKGAVCLVG